MEELVNEPMTFEEFNRMLIEELGSPYYDCDPDEVIHEITIVE